MFKFLKQNIFMLSFLLLISSKSVLAANNIEINNNSTGQFVESGVNMTKSSWFKVTIPKKIVIDGSKKDTYSQDYNVSVEGDLSGHETIYVEPQSTFKMYDSLGKEQYQGVVSQDKKSFTVPKAGLLETETIGTVSTSKIEAGSYNGRFSFNIYKEQISDHVFGNWSIERNATCEVEGLEKRVCSICGEIENRSIPSLGHNWKTQTDENGYYIQRCNNDNSHTKNNGVVTYTISYILNDGSISGQKTSYTVETNSFTLPTPTRNGFKFIGWTGSNGTTLQTSVQIVKGSTGNKSYTANWVADNYTVTASKGTGIKSISGAGSYKVGDKVTLVATLDGTCYSFSGWTGYTTGSSTTITFTMPSQNVSISASGAIITNNNSVHSFKAVDVKVANCTTSGTRQNKCENCGYALPDLMTVPALGHSYGEWVSTTGGYACTTSGTKTRTCTRCENKETQSIAALGHSYEVIDYYCNTCKTRFSTIPSGTTHTRSDNGSSCSGTIYVHKTCVYGCGTNADSIAAPLNNEKPVDNAVFDIQATVNGKIVSSTYSNNGYKTEIRVGSNTSSKTASTMSNGTTGTTVDKVLVQRYFSVDENNIATITYKITNNNTVNKYVDICFHCDAMVNGKDAAICTANDKGFTMTGNTTTGYDMTFQVYCWNYSGVDNMDGYWFGGWSNNTKEAYWWKTGSNYDSNPYSSDSGFTANWQNRLVQPGVTITLTTKIGLV